MMLYAQKVTSIVKNTFGGDSIGQKVKRGSIFLLLSTVLERIFDFVKKVILARILVPADFGLVGIAMIVISGLNALSDTGVKKALIQNPDERKSLLNTAWSIEIIRGGVLCCAIFFSAPLAGAFFNNENATNILRVMSVLPLMQGVTNIGTIHFDKELRFHKFVLYQQSNAFVSFLASLSCVLVWKNVWAIVAGSIAGGISQIAASYLLHPYRPSWETRRDEFKILFGFGKNLLVIGIITYIMNQGDNMLVGRLIGTSALGTYLLAYNLANLPVDSLAGLINRITFPVYARIQTNKAKLQHVFLQSFKFTMVLSVPIAIGLLLLSDKFVLLIYGSKWRNAIEPFQILCFLGLFRANSHVVAPLLHGVGKPNLAAKAKILELTVFGTLIYPLTLRYGMVGAALSGTITYCTALLLRYYYALRILSSSLKSMIWITLKIVLNSIGMVVALLLLRSFVHSIFSLLSLILIAAIAYFLMTMLTDKRWICSLAHR